MEGRREVPVGGTTASLGRGTQRQQMKLNQRLLPREGEVSPAPPVKGATRAPVKEVHDE